MSPTRRWNGGRGHGPPRNAPRGDTRAAASPPPPPTVRATGLRVNEFRHAPAAATAAPVGPPSTAVHRPTRVTPISGRTAPTRVGVAATSDPARRALQNVSRRPRTRRYNAAQGAPRAAHRTRTLASSPRCWPCSFRWPSRPARPPLPRRRLLASMGRPGGRPSKLPHLGQGHASMEAVPIGVTKPQRGYLEPGPVARFAWKALPPQRQGRVPRELQGRDRRLSARSPARHAHGAAGGRAQGRRADRRRGAVDRGHQGLGHEEAGPGTRAGLVAADQPDEAVRPAHRQHRPQPGQPHLRRRLAPLPHRPLARLHDAQLARRHRRRSASSTRGCGRASRRSRPSNCRRRSAPGSAPTSRRRSSPAATGCARPSRSWSRRRARPGCSWSSVGLMSVLRRRRLLVVLAAAAAVAAQPRPTPRRASSPSATCTAAWRDWSAS